MRNKAAPPRGICMGCNCTLTDDNAYDDTICMECYAAELEGEAMEEVEE